jgi:hypothetical protein
MDIPHALTIRGSLRECDATSEASGVSRQCAVNGDTHGFMIDHEKVEIVEETKPEENSEQDSQEAPVIFR